MGNHQPCEQQEWTEIPEGDFDQLFEGGTPIFVFDTQAKCHKRARETKKKSAPCNILLRGTQWEESIGEVVDSKELIAKKAIFLMCHALGMQANGGLTWGLKIVEEYTGNSRYGLARNESETYYPDSMTPMGGMGEKDELY